MALEERLELDIAEALRGVDTIEAALTASTQAFKVGIADALDLLSTVAIGEVDASVITSSIDEAVSAADLEPDILADAAGVTSAIDEAVLASDGSVDLDADGAGITTAIDEAVLAADPSLEIDADASAIPDVIAAALGEVDTGIEVEAITTGITEQIEAALSDVDTTVDIGADTSDAEASLAGLAEAGGAAEESLGGSADAMGALGGASQLATGDIAGISATLGAVSKQGSVIAGTLLTVGTTFGALASAALESDQAQRRYNTALGEFAEQVNQGVGIQGFAVNLDELAEKTGNSDEAMKLAAARVFEFGQSAGVAGPQVAETTKQILLLATNATTANPALGDAGAATDQLTTALARGGKTLVDFGISLTPRQIELEALAQTGKSAAEELTFYDRAAAGASLATQQLGDSLRENIVQNADQPAIALRRLKEEFGNALEEFGKPLLEPTIEALKTAQPLLIDLASIFSELGTVVIPIVSEALKPLSFTLDLLAEGAGFVGRTMERARREFTFLGLDAEKAEEPVVDLTAALSSLSGSTASIRSGLDQVILGIEASTQAAEDAVEAENVLIDARISSVDAIFSAESAHRDFGDALDEVARTGQERFRQGLQDEVEAAKEAEAALNGLLDAQIGFLDSSIGAETANRRFGEALADVTNKANVLANTNLALPDEASAAQDAFAESVRDVRDAALAAAKGELRLAEDRAKAAGTTLSATERQKAFASALERAAAQASGPAKDAILALVETYNALPDDVTTTVKSDTSQAQRAQTDYAESIRDVTEKARIAAAEDLKLADMRAANAGRLLGPIEREAIWRESLDASASAAGRVSGAHGAAVRSIVTAYDSLPKNVSTLVDADTKPAADKLTGLAALIKADVLTVATKTIDANIAPAKAKILELSAAIKTDLNTLLTFAVAPAGPVRPPGAMAGGTFGPGLLTVGEAGRELINIQPGNIATVTPNRQTEDLLAGRGAAFDPEFVAAIKQLASQPRIAVDGGINVVGASGADSYATAVETVRQLDALAVRMAAG